MNKYFCNSPFYQLEISPQGTARICCKMPATLITDKTTNRQYTIQKDGITAIWESEWMNDFRQRFINEEKRPECKQCWDDEAAGVFSFRQQQSHIPVSVDKPVIRELVLKLSNKCNCACRICTWYLSSLWQSELEKTNRFSREDAKWFILGNESDKITPENFEDWKKHLATVEHLSLYGGEPLLNEEVLKTLEYLIEHNRAKDVELGLNTNGTVVSNKVINILRQFKHVNLHFSIDDLHERFNYQRWPAKYDNIFADLKEIHDTYNQKQMRIFLYTTISVFNIMNMKNILDEWRKYPKFEVNIENIIHEPKVLVPYNLPEIVKPKIEEYLNQADWSEENNNYHRDNMDWKQQIINFMYLYKSPYSSCEEYIKALDDYLGFDDVRRKQDWKTTFPELYELLSISDPVVNIERPVN